MPKSDVLWQEISRAGVRGYVEGRWIFDRRPLANLTEALGIGTHRGLHQMMRISGIAEAYITGGASDYDKLKALCGALHLWTGHPYAGAISAVTERLSGMSLSLEALPKIWEETAARLTERPTTYGDLVRDFGVRRLIVMLEPNDWIQLPKADGVVDDSQRCLLLSDLADRALWSEDEAVSQGDLPDMAGLLNRKLNDVADKGCCGIAVDLSEMDTFLRPNPYTPAKAVQKLQKMGMLTAEEAALMVAQGMRLLGAECVRRQWCLTVLNPSPRCWMSLWAYMGECHCLPSVTVISERPYETIIPGVATQLAVDPLVPAHLLEQQISVTAAKMPLGCLGGLYLPVCGPVDLRSIAEVGRAVCRCVTDPGEICGGLCTPEEQVAMAKRILC